MGVIMNLTDCNQIFGERLKELKNKTDSTWEKVHEETGISKSTIYSYIDKKQPKKPTLYNAKRLAKYFNVSLSYLCGELDENNIYDVSVIEAFFKVLNVCNPEINTNSEYPTLVFNKYDDNNNADIIRKFLNEYEYLKKVHSDGIIPEKLLNDFEEDLKHRYTFIPNIPDYQERIAIDKEVKEKEPNY